MMKKTVSLPKISKITEKRMPILDKQIEMLNNVMIVDDGSEDEREIMRRFNELKQESEKRKKKYYNSKIYLCKSI